MKIGYGCGSTSASTGSTDVMSYHTGTVYSSRSTYGEGIQYRYVEGLWSGVRNFIDGIRMSSANVYVISNPSDFSDSSNGTFVANSPHGGYEIKSWSANPATSGYEYAIIPASFYSTEDYNTYITDYANVLNQYNLMYVGSTGNNKGGGLFMFLTGYTSTSSSEVGSRLMVLPSQRIN